MVVNTLGAARGSRTRRNACHLVQPTVMAASSRIQTPEGWRRTDELSSALELVPVHAADGLDHRVLGVACTHTARIVNYMRGSGEASWVGALVGYGDLNFFGRVLQ